MHEYTNTQKTLALHPELAVTVIIRSFPHSTAWHSYAPGTSGSAMSLSRAVRPLLRGALVVVATVGVAMVVAMVMAVAAAAATATREVALPRRGGAMTACDVDEVRAYAPDNSGADATAE